MKVGASWLVLIFFKHNIQQRFPFVQRVSVRFHRPGAGPTHESPKTIQQFRLKSLVILRTLLDFRDPSAHTQVPDVVRRELDAFLFFELPLSWLEELLPMVIKS